MGNKLAQNSNTTTTRKESMMGDFDSPHYGTDLLFRRFDPKYQCAKPQPIDALGRKIDGPSAESNEYWEAEKWPEHIWEQICTHLNIEYPGYEMYPRHEIRWADHNLVETARNGDKLYVSHPYHLTAKDMRQLAKLGEHGWKIWVNGASSYFTGHTVRVQLEPPTER